MKKNVLNVLLVLLGNLILAFDVAAFVIPYGFVMGGATGMALTLQHFTGFDLSIAVSIINAVVWTLGLVFLGKKFAMATLLSTITYPIFLTVFRNVTLLSHLTDDLLMAAIYAGLLLGLGIAVVIRAGASTGGLDVFPLIFNKYFHLPVAPLMYLVDFIVLLSQVFFSDSQQILYGILLLMLSSITLNYMLMSGKRKVQLMIISKEFKAIKECLLKELDMGATMMDIETAYSQEKQQAVLVITNNRKMYAVMDMVQRLDNKAFITISSTNEVKGRGFSMER